MLPFLLWNCESENVELLRPQSRVETVSVGEAIDFLILNPSSKPTKTAKKVCFIPHLTYISQYKD